MQVELDASVVFQHLEANRVLPTDGFLLGINTDVEVVIKQIIIGAPGAVFAAKDPAVEIKALRARCTERA